MSDDHPTPSPEPGSTRASLVDVVENALGEDIARLPKGVVGRLPRHEVEELAFEVDTFLQAVQHDALPDEAVVLDSLTNPIAVADDPTEPATTRKARQVALYHREVVLPIQPIVDAVEHVGIGPLESLVAWSRVNHRLLRAHVFSPMQRLNPLALFGQSECERLIAEVSDVILGGGAPEILRQLALPGLEQGSEEEREWVEDSVLSVLIDAANAGQATANLTFLEADAGALYHRMATWIAEVAGAEATPPTAHAALLKDLDLPAIDDLPDTDFVAIRLQSDDFEEFRGVLGRVLRRTHAGVGEGGLLQDAFEDNLDEVRTRALLLRTEIQDQSLRSRLRSGLQTYSLGALASGAGAAATAAMMGAVAAVPIAAGAAVTALVGTLATVLTYRAPEREERMLRFYSTLLPDA